jgi:antirestriction protein ArdC
LRRSQAASTPQFRPPQREPYTLLLCGNPFKKRVKDANGEQALATRFGDEAYSFEELVAELGAAFVCGDLGIPTRLREDHASYIAHWLGVLKADKRAIFTAASKAVAFRCAPQIMPTR